MTSELLKERNIPQLLTDTDWVNRRQELLRLFQEHVYGLTPAAPSQVSGKVLERVENACANKAIDEQVEITWQTPAGSFTLPIRLVYPKTNTPCPAFVFINFRPDAPDKYWPIEELVDSGYAVARIYYQDVTADSAERDKLALLYPDNGEKTWGKIGMWAFACSRVLDYLLTRPNDFDGQRVAVIGHSRLGKTALWCGAQDERFSLTISNDSGCSGAAITRGKVGESLERITNVFPFWFCPQYLTYAGRLSELPVDQHQLLALAAPRALCVGSAIEDVWADPQSEFLSCCAASEAYEALGKAGLKHEDRLPEVNEALHEGNIGYHMRSGSHYLSRIDWLQYVAFRKLHNV